MGRRVDAPGSDEGSEVVGAAGEAGVEVSRVDIGGVQFAVFSVARAAPLSVLTPAEQQVVALVLEGLSNREIAAARAVSVKTIANQLGAVYEKLGISSRFELAALE